jgi:hypothetical protein
MKNIREQSRTPKHTLQRILATESLDLQTGKVS